MWSTPFGFPYMLFPRFPVLQFGAMFSSPAFSDPAFLTVPRFQSPPPWSSSTALFNELRDTSNYTVSRKKGATKFFAITLLSPNRSSKFFYLTISSKFAINKSLNILLWFTRVATLPCKTVVLKNRKLHW